MAEFKVTRRIKKLDEKVNEGNMFELGFNGLVLSVLFGVFCFTIWKFKVILKSYKDSKGIYTGGVLYSAYAAATFALMYNPLDAGQNEVVEFKRVIGVGVAANVDVSRRTGRFSVWFILLAVIFVIMYLAVSYFLNKQKTEEETNIVEFLDNLIVVANINLVLRCITFFNNHIKESGAYDYASYLLIVIIIVQFAYLILHLDRKITADSYVKLMFAGFSIAYPILIILQKDWREGKSLLGIQMVLFAVCIIGVKISNGFWRDKMVETVLSGVAIIVGFIPLVTSFYIELIHILNQHDVFVICLRRDYAVIIIFQLIFAFVFGVWSNKKQFNLSKWKRWAYPGLILGMVCLSVQLPLEAYYDAKIFEAANFSIPISDFLNFGSIPLVEHYSGHMMSWVWEGLIYALLNNDWAGAIFSPYSVYINVVYIILFYYLVKWIWNDDMAICVALLIPYRNNWYYFGLGMLVCVAIISYVKKNSYPRAAIVWFACIWCAIYRLDIGAAFGMACIIALTIYVIVFRNLKAGRQLAASFFVWAFLGILIWFVLCIVKGLNPFNRLREFLEISLSNANWAYDSIGNAGNSFFSWCYIVVPFTVLICLVCTLFSEQLRKKAGIERWIILLVMGFSYFFNFSRGLVRHSLVEEAWASVAIIWSGYVFLALFISCIKDNRKLFLPVFMALILCDHLFVMSDNFDAQPISNTVVSKTGEFVKTWTSKNASADHENEERLKTYWEELNEKNVRVNRIQWKDSLADMIRPYQFVLDGLLEQEETYVDFINKSFVYSAVNRRCPVYVSQSPLQLSGEFAQEMFIQEMQGIPLVLMPIGEDVYNSASLDGIANAYRYYKVSEYIYQNYRPLCKCEDIFAVWCLKDRYEEFVNRFERMTNEREYPQGHIICEKIEYGYDGPYRNEDNSFLYMDILHDYDINQLPKIWGECDKKDAKGNEVVKNLGKDGDFFIFQSVEPSVKGNYLKINTLYSGETRSNFNDNNEIDEGINSAVIKVGEYKNGVFTEKYQYEMMLSEGRHDYLIRVSTDYYWYNQNVNAVYIQTDAMLYETSMSILEGD